ncbi:MAG: hypothetical protein ACLP6W_05990, partial [Bryobacteraceae bacterium]
GCGSPFPVRYVSGGLLFLKPLGTFINMHRDRKRVNQFLQHEAAFPQDVFVVFRSGYRLSL